MSAPAPFHYRDGAPGHRGSRYSVEAADSIASVVAGMRDHIAADIRRQGANGSTTDEAGSRLNLNRQQTAPRIAELHRDGRLIDSGQARPNASGRLATVWVTPEHAPPGAKPKQRHSDDEVSAIMVRLARFQTWLAEQAANRADDRALAAGAKLVGDVRGLISGRGLKRKGASNG